MPASQRPHRPSTVGVAVIAGVREAHFRPVVTRLLTAAGRRLTVGAERVSGAGVGVVVSDADVVLGAGDGRDGGRGGACTVASAGTGDSGCGGGSVPTFAALTGGVDL